ncbi:MAG: PQQ-dependent sugar dehydrogenase, partial [Actinomycetota bacterium]
MRRASLALVVVLGALAACGPQRAGVPSPSANGDSTSETVDAGERPETVQPVASGAAEFASLSLVAVGSLEQPVDVAARPGDDAIYFVSVMGTIHRFTSAGFDTTPVLDISDLTDGNGERGLLGLAFSNDGTTAYVNYTNLDGHNTIASLRVNAVGQFDRATLRTLLVIEQPFRNHNAGDIVVEPSGMLLVPMGDGGSADDPQRLSLDDKSMLGKILRVDPRDGTVRVLAKGLRNPWRIDLFEDRLWLADVGQNQWEEVSVLDDVSRRVGEAFGNATGGGAADASAPVDVVDFGWSAY